MQIVWSSPSSELMHFPLVSRRKGWLNGYRKKFWCIATFTNLERRSWIDANEEIDIADSAGSSLKMSSSFTMQRAIDALLDYWIIDCYQKLLVRFRLELKLQIWNSNSTYIHWTTFSFTIIIKASDILNWSFCMY